MLIFVFMKTKKEKTYWNEEWKVLKLEDAPEKYKYEISNYGRVRSFFSDPENGKILKLGTTEGFKIIRYFNNEGRYVGKCIHKIVAKYFLDPPLENQTLVLHNDYNRLNNYFQNLRWASHRERYDHWKKFKPDWFGDEKKKKPAYSKLTESEARLLKKKLLNPKRKTRLKILARQFGVSEMQLHRIKTGENWGHIKV